MSTIELRWRKVVNELKYLYKELELSKEIGKESAQSFQEYYEQFCASNEIDPHDLYDRNQERVDNLYTPPPLEELIEENEEQTPEEKEEDDVHKSFYRVYRKLAFHLHPDRQPADITTEEKEENTRMFREAKDALDNKHYFILLDLAEQFGIESPTNYKEQIRWMRKEVKAVDQKIADEKGTYNYLFGETETDEERDKLIKTFLKQVYDFSS